MKALKYSKWVLAAALLAAAPAFTSCSDDDDVIVNSVPEQFSTVLSTLNIEWDETEGVVDFGAPEKWKAESVSRWIEVDPTKGDAGEYRLYLKFEPNPYALPRTGEVHIICGDEFGKITVTQAGAPAEVVAPTALDLEVPSLDYATNEISLVNVADDIMGNLGLTVEEFAAGVGDDGNVEFFMVGKDGQWIAGGTSGTRCGAWLDSSLNVTQWNGAGYPAIATFIEVYGDEGDPVIVIGRAPGVPDDQEYDLNFGFTLADDHSKYIIFNLHVVFPKMDLKGTLVGTFDLEVNTEPVGYDAFPVAFDAPAVMSLLGASSMALAKVVSYDRDGEFIPYTANNGYWFDTKGAVGSWGEGAGWFMEFYGDDPEADEEALSSFYFGTFPGVTDVSGTSQIGFWYNNNVVMFNVKVTIGEGSGETPDDPNPGDDALDIVAIYDLDVTHMGADDDSAYAADPLPFDAEAAGAALGAPVWECEFISLNEDGDVVPWTATVGYWFDFDGNVGGWGDTASWYIEYYGGEDEAEAEDFNNFFVGSFPGYHGSGACVIGFKNDNKVVLYNVNVTVE